MFKASQKLALLIFTATLSLPAMASVDWISVGFARICTDTWGFENTQWVDAMKVQLKGRRFAMVKKVYEKNENGTVVSSESDLASLLESYPARQMSEGEDQVYPYLMSFQADLSVKLNDQHVVKTDFEGCGGGEVTIYNIINQPNHSRFFGSLKVTGGELKICDFDCDRPLAPGEYRYTYIFQEQ